MKILVTGSSGFIGRNLVETLLEKGYSVIGIDKNKSQSMDDNFEFIHDNINYIDLYSKNFDDVDEVYHLAASADIKKSFLNTRMDLENNVVGTHSVLELMRKKDIKNLAFASSSAVYGISKEIPTPETAELMPINLYGASKLAGENFVDTYSEIYGIKQRTFRFAQVVGKYEHRGVIVDFFNKLQKNKNELEILGDGNQNKSYFDVSDCVNAMLLIKKVGKYNLGNYETIKVTKLADIICDELNVKPVYKYTGGTSGWKGDTPYCILLIEKALKEGWKPKYNCEEAIRRTVRYLNDINNNYF